MVCQAVALSSGSRCFAHRDAYKLFDEALRGARLDASGGTVILDMSGVEEVTTSAFARLVLLRRELRRQGRDLKLIGLRARAEKLYEINRLNQVLPRS
jgi:ABC-type transporter Mla MlaB component